MGGRVGFATALASFLLVWYLFISPANTLSLAMPSDWTRLLLIGATFAAMVFVGDAFRRLRRANARLSSTVERLDAIIDSMADGVLVLDPQGTLLQANKAMRRLYGGDIPVTVAERTERWHARNADQTPW